MADSSLRKVIILQELPVYPRYITARTLNKQLCERGFAVSLRTTQRDLLELSAHFNLIDIPNNDEHSYGWAVRRRVLDHIRLNVTCHS